MNKPLLSITFVLMLLATLTSSPAVAGGVICPVGQQSTHGVFDADGNYTPPETPCENAKWNLNNVNDGFTKGLYIYMPPSPNSLNSAGPEDWVAISCEKKKLNVFVLFEYPYGPGWTGKGQFLFDSGKPSSFKYSISRDFSYLSLNSPKDFLTKLLKAQNSFTLKVPLVSGTKIGLYSKGDIVEYKETFAKAGCKF